MNHRPSEAAALLGELDALVARAKPIPLTRQIRIERRELDDLLDRLRSALELDAGFMWDKALLSLRAYPDLPDLLATADLAERARPRWETKVVPHTEMDTLIFTLPEDEYPWHERVQVGRVGALAWDRVPPDDRDAFEFQLTRDLHLITADRATDETALAVLDAFLMQLTGT